MNIITKTKRNSMSIRTKNQTEEKKNYALETKPIPIKIRTGNQAYINDPIHSKPSLNQ